MKMRLRKALSRTVAVVLTAGARACNYDYQTFNACLDFQSVADGVWNAHVGLDAFMPERHAQEIVSYGAGFRATLFNSRGQFIAYLSILPGWPAAGPDALAAELAADGLTRDVLDENPYGEDAFYAVVSYFDFHQHQSQWFTTGTVRGEFGYTGGGSGCLVAC
jgi:hypothetical protein